MQRSTPEMCQRCAYARRTDLDEVLQFTEAERIALSRTGFSGERRGIPIIDAAVLPLAGVIAFHCPWSELPSPPVLKHGPDPRGDEHGHIHRLSHCEAYPGGYFLRPFFP